MNKSIKEAGIRIDRLKDEIHFTLVLSARTVFSMEDVKALFFEAIRADIEVSDTLRSMVQLVAKVQEYDTQ